MNYNLICKKVELSEARKDALMKKIKKLDKFLSADSDCKITVSEQRNEMVIEIMILNKGFILYIQKQAP